MSKITRKRAQAERENRERRKQDTAKVDLAPDRATEKLPAWAVLDAKARDQARAKHKAKLQRRLQQYIQQKEAQR